MRFARHFEASKKGGISNEKISSCSVAWFAAGGGEPGLWRNHLRDGIRESPVRPGFVARGPGWLDGRPPPLSPNAAVISNDLVFSGQQAVRVRGADLVHQDFINEATHGYYDAIGSYRRTVNFDAGAAGFPIMRVQANVRIDGPKTPPGAAADACVAGKHHPCNNFFSAGIVAVGNTTTGGSPGIGELDISSDGKVYGHSGNALVPKFLTSHPISLGAWHTLAIDVDFKNLTYSFSVDGKSLPGGPFPFDAEVDTNVLKRGSLLVFTAPDTIQLKKSNYVVHDDNFSIATR